MPFELRPPTRARTPSLDSSRTPAPRADGNRFFKDLAERRAARMRAMDDARQGAQNAYEDAPASRPKARIPMPQTPAHYTPPDTVSWRLGIEEERQARHQAALEREQEERVARLRGETDLDAPVYGPQTRLEAARARARERSQFRPTAEQSRTQHEENLRAIERQQILQELDALQHRTERPAKAREALIDDVYNFDEPVARPLEPTPEGIRRNRLAESRQKMEARRARANDPELTFGDVVELDSDLLEEDEPTPLVSARSSDRRAALAELERAIGPLKREIPQPIQPLSREQITTRSLEQQPWTYQEKRAAQQEMGRETPRRITPIDREREAIIAPIRANQAAAQESANALKSSIARLTNATQTLSENFKNRFGMPIEALENGSGSLLQEAKIGLLNFGASLGKLFGKQAESPQSLLAQYKEQDALLNNALAEQRKYMDDARRLQRQIDEIQNPLQVATERDRVNVNTLLNRVGTPGRRVAMDTEPTATPFSESTWFQEGQDDSPVINQPYQEGFRARRKREDEDRRVEALLAPIEATFSSATRSTINLLYSTNLEELKKRLPLAERSLRDLHVATHTDRNKEGDRPALKALRSTVSNIQAACKNLSRQSLSNNLLEDTLALAKAITQNGIETLDLAARDPGTSRPERQLLEATISNLTAWKEAYKNHFASLQMGNGARSETISIPRSDGTRTMGYVGQVIGDNVRVLWEDEVTGRQKQKDIPVAVLGAYQFAQAMLENRESFEM